MTEDERTEDARSAILELLEHEGRPLTAGELLCFMRGRRITPLFRNQVLADLIKDGLIEQVSLPVIRILVAYKIAT